MSKQFPPDTTQEDPGLSDLYQHIQQAVKKAVEAESARLKTIHDETLQHVKQQRDASAKLALQYHKRLEEYTQNDTGAHKKLKAKLERVKKEVMASNERILKIITEPDDVTVASPTTTTTTTTTTADASESAAKQAMMMIKDVPVQDLTEPASAGVPKKNPIPAEKKKVASPAKRTKVSVHSEDDDDGMTDDEKVDSENVLYEKSRSERQFKVDFSDCTLEYVAMTTIDFVNFSRHFHFNDAQKEVVNKRFMPLIKTPVQAVNGSCIVCGSFCNKGMTGIYCSHVTCAKCFAMYLYFAGEKFQGNWKTKNRYLKCPGSVLKKQCIFMTTQ